MFDTTSEKKFLLKQLVKKDLTAKYKDSVLGILWSFFNPLLIMIVFTAIFSMLFGRSIENYPVYFLSGRLIYDFYNSAEFVNFLISFVILFGVMIVTGAQFHLTSIYAIIPIFLLVILIFGVGLILAVCNTYFSDIGYLYNVFTLILMYASALFYPMEIVPGTVQRIFSLNPVYSAISCFREAVVYGVVPDLSTLLYLAAFAFTVFFIGILLFSIYDKKLALEI